MTLLVSYDIENDRLRLKAANKLIEYGFIRLQKSVFAGSPKETVWKECLKWLTMEIIASFQSDDKFFYLPLTDGQSKLFVFLPASSADWEEITNPPNTLFM